MFCGFASAFESLEVNFAITDRRGGVACQNLPSYSIEVKSDTARLNQFSVGGIIPSNLLHMLEEKV